MSDTKSTVPKVRLRILFIVRFPTASKDSRDSIYIFRTIIAGIRCGVGDYMVAAMGSTVTFLVILMLDMMKYDNRMMLIIRASYNRKDVIQSYIFKTFHRKAVLRVHNTTETRAEFIYETSSKLLSKAENENTGITNGIYALAVPVFYSLHRRPEGRGFGDPGRRH